MNSVEGENEHFLSFSKKRLYTVSTFLFSLSVLKLPGTSKTVQLVMIDTTLLCCRK